MLYLIHTHWLWFFGALVLGIVVGWLTYLAAATRWTDRPVHIASGVVAIGAIVAITELVPGRDGYWLELGVILAVFYTVGCIVGWALRDLAEFMPAAANPGLANPGLAKPGLANPGAAASAATTGSYLFRDAFAEMGVGTAYLRSAPADGGVTRARLASSTGTLTQAPTKAPAAGGYTFPKTLPFADATTSRRAEPAPGLRRHWSWQSPAGGASATTVGPAFTGSKGGYVFPTAAAGAAFAGARVGTTRAGLYKHWTWRGAEAADAQAAPVEGPAPVTAPVGATAFGSAIPAEPAVGSQDTPLEPTPAATASTAAIDAPATTSGAGGTPFQEAPSGAPPSPSPITPAGMAATSAAPAAAPSTASPNQDRSAPADATTEFIGGEQTTGSHPTDGEGPSAAPETSRAPAPIGRSAVGTSADAGPPSAAVIPPRATSGQDGSGGSPSIEPTGSTVSGAGELAATGGATSPTSKPSGVGPSTPMAATEPGALPSVAPTSTPAASATSPTAGVGGDPSSAQTRDSAPPSSAPSAATTDGGPSTSRAKALLGVPGGVQTTEAPSANVGSPETPGDAGGGAPIQTPMQTPIQAPIQAPVGSGSAGGEGSVTSPAPAPVSATTTAGLPAAPPSAPGQPATIAAVPGEEKHGGERPEGLMTARDNRPDDLKRIRGIGPQNEGRLHGLGIWHFDQIAAWSVENVRWVGSYLAFPGRIGREKWVEQAKVLAGGGATDFSKRMLAGEVATSIDDGSQGQTNIAADLTPSPRKPPRPKGRV